MFPNSFTLLHFAQVSIVYYITTLRTAAHSPLHCYTSRKPQLFFTFLHSTQVCLISITVSHFLHVSPLHCYTPQTFALSIRLVHSPDFCTLCYIFTLPRRLHSLLHLYTPKNFTLSITFLHSPEFYTLYYSFTPTRRLHSILPCYRLYNSPLSITFIITCTSLLSQLHLS